MHPVNVDGLFGWFHPGTRRRGAILCGAFGHEGLWAGRSWRLLAESIAAAGVPALRFDYAGSGDSLGSMDDPDRAAAWLASIRAAVAWMRTEAGVEEVALVGLRLGGLLAAWLAVEFGTESLVLLAPFATGRGFVRDMQGQARILGRLPDGRPAPPDAPGTLTVGGFPLSAQTMEALRRIDAQMVSAGPARALVAAPPASIEAATLARSLAARGTAVEVTDFPGFPDIVANPLEAKPPHALFARIGAFLAQGAPLADVPARKPAPALWRAPDFHEEVLRFGAQAGLAGVLCRPERPRGRADLAVVLVNAGFNPRTGWARGTVTLARRLAGEGTPSLRLDVSGIGDSPERPGVDLPLFHPTATADVAAAIDALAGEGVREVVLVGSCSGAYLALHAALADGRVVGAALVNMPKFFWEPGADIAAALRDPYRHASGYLGIARSGAAWKRVLRGEVDVLGIVRRLSARALAGLWRRTRDAIPGVPSVKRRSERAMQTLAGRGTRMLFVYSDADSGLSECSRLFGARGDRLARRYGHTLRILPDADHDLTPRLAREAMFGEVEALVRAVAVAGVDPATDRSLDTARARAA